MAKPTVLVVDPDDQARATLRRWLSARGHHVLEAASGKAAYRLLLSSIVDAIILSRFSPITESLALAKAIRQTPSATVPVIVLAHDRVEQFAARVGTAYALQNPPEEAELTALLERALRAARAATEATPELTGRRRHPRYSASLRVGFQVFGKAGTLLAGNGATGDLSAGGCSVLAIAPPSRGARVAMTLQLPTRERLKVGGTVVWSRHTRGSGDGAFGVHWIGALPDSLYGLLAECEARELLRDVRMALPPVEASGEFSVAPATEIGVAIPRPARASARDRGIGALQALLGPIGEVEQRRRIDQALAILEAVPRASNSPSNPIGVLYAWLDLLRTELAADPRRS
jgi:CheY-like chemotaxis protein